MNRYGAMAQSHWKTHRPRQYAAIPDPGSFFSELGVQVSDRIATLELGLLDPDQPDEDFFGRVGRRNMARFQAEELTLREMVLLPAEQDESETDELPPEWAIPSAQETVAAVAGQQAGPV